MHWVSSLNSALWLVGSFGHRPIEYSLCNAAPFSASSAFLKRITNVKGQWEFFVIKPSVLLQLSRLEYGRPSRQKPVRHCVVQLCWNLKGVFNYRLRNATLKRELSSFSLGPHNDCVTINKISPRRHISSAYSRADNMYSDKTSTVFKYTFKWPGRISVSPRLTPGESYACDTHTKPVTQWTHICPLFLSSYLFSTGGAFSRLKVKLIPRCVSPLRPWPRCKLS